MVKRGAIELALDLYRHPIKVKAARKAALPHDMMKLIRIVSGSDDELESFDVNEAKSPTELRDAAAFFMQQVMFQTGNSPYRMLGLNNGAEAQHIKDHKRLLLKWLHPDRNQNKWERVYFQRVLRAAESLEGEAGTSRVPIEISQKPKHAHQTTKMKLHMQALHHKQKTLRNRVRTWLKRILLLIMLFLIAVIGFSTLRNMGYIPDDLPLLDQLRAWLR